jgi:hypothetical protein
LAGAFPWTLPAETIVFFVRWGSLGRWGTSFRGFRILVDFSSRISRIRSGETFPMFPTFTKRLICFVRGGGTCVGGLRFRTRLFPTAFVVARTGGLCFRDRVFGNQLPLLRLVAHARGIDPQGQRANMKDAVAHPSQRFAEPRSLGTIAALAKRERGLARERDPIEIAGSDHTGLKLVPPLPTKARHTAPSPSAASSISSTFARKPDTPATERMPPMTADQASKLPRLALPRGIPAAIHARHSVRQAATKCGRLVRTHATRLGCRNPLRRHG